MTLRSKFIMLTLGLTTLFSVLMVYDRVRTARNGMLERAEDRAAYIISFITDISAGQLEGEGIPDSFREEIFKKYSGMSKSSKNMGLGLAFCKLVAETHCAEMDVRSAAGKGTEVSFFSFSARRFRQPGRRSCCPERQIVIAFLQHSLAPVLLFKDTGSGR